MSIQNSLVDTLDAFIRRRLAEVNVSIPGRVESYDSSKQSANVQPLIQEVYTKDDGTRGVRNLPTIQAVPIAFPGAGSYGFTFPLAKGDTVMLLFSQASTDKWRKHGGLVDPLEDSRHDFSDAIAIPGLRSFNDATDQVADAAVIFGPEIRLGSKDASEFLALKSDVAAMKAVFDNHTHAYIPGTLASAPSSGPISPFPTPVGTTKVKAE